MNPAGRISLESHLRVPLPYALPSQNRATARSDYDTDVSKMKRAVELLLASASSGARNPILFRLPPVAFGCWVMRRCAGCELSREPKPLPVARLGRFYEWAERF